MTAINQQKKRIATWLSRTRLPNELSSLNDRALQERRLIRYQPTLKACKPLWMSDGRCLVPPAADIEAGTSAPFNCDVFRQRRI